MKLLVQGRPPKFYGVVRLPPSKSYLHRALLVSSLVKKSARLTECGEELADDVSATIEAIRAFGSSIRYKSEAGGTIEVVPRTSSEKSILIFARGSGTTARFVIAYAALANEGVKVRISGDASLSQRPMQSICDALSQLGVNCSFSRVRGRLPVVVRGGGINGGECTIDGSISSQFISSLLISCTRARKDCTIWVKDPKSLVSRPYIDATLSVLSHFGLHVTTLPNYSGFKIKGNQVPKSRTFSIPGDMSSGAALVGATLAAGGSSKLIGMNNEYPQSDSKIVSIARKFGARVVTGGNSLEIMSTSKKQRELTLDLRESPDLVPVVAGLAAALATKVKISNIEHLRFKESDRISVLSRELRKLGVNTNVTSSSLAISSSRAPKTFRKPIVINPERDHRMVMALTVAGLSGRFGKILISDQDCVNKSYPEFVKDLQFLCHEKSTLKLVGVLK